MVIYIFSTILLLSAVAGICPTFASSIDSSPTDELKIVASIEIELNTSNTDVNLDKNEKCEEWAKMGECNKNRHFMFHNCAASCNIYEKAKAYVYDGEDAAIAAFRFAEDYSSYFDLDTESQQEKVLDVAKELRDVLETNKYTPPQELTHCGKRLCSAGKLWKRAEEMRKALLVDTAGADLIRAMLKTGIEIDFIERCKRSLQWAFGSIQRQREREKKEAIEEAKLEARRKEEQLAMDEAVERKKGKSCAMIIGVY